jgi:hypothetical protein
MVLADVFFNCPEQRRHKVAEMAVVVLPIAHNRHLVVGLGTKHREVLQNPKDVTHD